MSHLENIDALERQLEELQMTKEMCSIAKPKKIPPAVPPKKKAQPQVPHSALVTTLREPSYSTKISPSPSNNNLPTKNIITNSSKHYANVNNIGDFLSDSIPHHSSYPLYSNTPTYQNDDLCTRAPSPLPPPPPPPPPSTKSMKYSLNSQEYMSPPSPVSSNYSELAHATENINYNQDRSHLSLYQNDFPEYNISQATNNYESLYEPINPRPSGHISPHTDNSNQKYRNNMAKKPFLPKEEEVDALTNLLVKSISDSQDLEIIGTCIKCAEKITGENAGLTAMGNMYHIQCFVCQRCNINLQGKPFYAVENQPYCESDYYETLEKCCVCKNTILDRILRATGKPYHPNCFTCVECGKSLDGVPFTVDAMNQIHCIHDFHKKFAPRCCVCELPIMPEEGQEETVRVVALDRSFHVKCYRCEDCGLLLSSESEGRGCYPLDDHILCKTCNAHRIRLLTNVMTTDL